MDYSTPALELELAQERFEAREARAARDFSFGDTNEALSIANSVFPRLLEHVQAKTAGRKTNSYEGKVARVLEALDAECVTLCALQGALHGAAVHQGRFVKCASAVGKLVENELWAGDLRQHDDKLASWVEASVRREHGNLKYRLQAARSIARRAGFSWGQWTGAERITVGVWLLNALLEALPDVFGTEEEAGGDKLLVIQEHALEAAQAVCRQLVNQRPYYLPDQRPPIPWTGWSQGGPVDPRVRATLMRTRHRETAGIVRSAIKSGQMQPALDALNAVQATGWTINRRVLAVMEECIERGIEVEGVPSPHDVPMPVKPRPWDDMTDLERDQWRVKASEVKKANLTLRGDRIGFTEDLETARQLAECATFYTPCNMDWRGRVYPLPNFNFQRSDRVRGLFLFARGEEIGEEGLKWLKVHLANCGDFGKVSKKSFEERLAWTNDNMDMIREVARDPLNYGADWRAADKPWMFLAACLELTDAVDALTQGLSYSSHLPVSWDGSCSGLQHLCAMTRAAEGFYVNLTDGEAPEDVYQRVAEAAAETIKLAAEEGDRVAKRALAFGIDRKVVKRNVMTFAYSSKKSGMSNQQDEDLMAPLAKDVLLGKCEEHPFGDDATARGKAPSYAARFLAKHTYDAITSIVRKPAEAMGCLQSIARALAHEGKHVEWTTPTGLPWVNRYHEVNMRRVQLWLHDRGVRLPFTPVVADGHLKKVDRTRAANGVSPNFVHALDAAHLALTVNAAVREGITSFALVHDSFGCHAARAERFHRIIREQFVAMYEAHDPLTEVLERAKCVLSVPNLGRLPSVPDKGPLNIKEVLNATYAFA